MVILCRSASGRVQPISLYQLKGMGKVGNDLVEVLIKENRGQRAQIKLEKIMYLYEAVAFAKAIFIRCVDHPSSDDLFFQDEIARQGDGLFPPMCFSCYEKAKHDALLEDPSQLACVRRDQDAD